MYLSYTRSINSSREIQGNSAGVGCHDALMGATFERVRDRARSEVDEFLAAQSWPFHGRPTLSLVDAHAVVLEADDVESFAIRDQGELVGLVRLFDLDDMVNGSPLFDLRIAADHRGRGLGTATVTWLSAHLFDSHPELHRIEATTRGDNVAMATVLERCGYVREGVLREAWRSENGERHDTLVYGLLRSDWRAPTEA
jgi:RimJ/RimL family protein N-acetyltransferase